MAPEVNVADIIAKHREKKERIVFTNGCFDLLHVGHVRYLQEAKALGDILVVGLNSDSSIKRLKGAERPVIPENERREVLRSLRSVDHVFIFADDTPLALIEKVKPDVLVKGGDWPVETIVGYEFVSGYGGQVKTLSFYQGHSTTAILEKVRKL